MGRVIERIFRNLGLYDSDQRNVKKDTEMVKYTYLVFLKYKRRETSDLPFFTAQRFFGIFLLEYEIRLNCFNN